MNKTTILHLQHTFFLYSNLSSLHDHDVKFNSRELSHGKSHGHPERLPYVWKTRKFRGDLSRYYLFSETTENFCTICLHYQCQASFPEIAKTLPLFCKWYDSIPFLFSVPKKLPVPLTEIFHRSFRANGTRFRTLREKKTTRRSLFF